MSLTRSKLNASVSVRGGYSVRYTRSSVSTTCMYTLLTVCETTTHGSYARIRSYTSRSVFRFRNESSLMFRRARSEPEPVRAITVPAEQLEELETSPSTLTCDRCSSEPVHPLNVHFTPVYKLPVRSRYYSSRYRTLRSEQVTAAVPFYQCTQLSDWSEQ